LEKVRKGTWSKQRGWSTKMIRKERENTRGRARGRIGRDERRRIKNSRRLGDRIEIRERKRGK
jgi:hypothetical protein